MTEPSTFKDCLREEVGIVAMLEFLDQLAGRIDGIEATLQRIEQRIITYSEVNLTKGATIMAQLDDLTKKVQQTNDVEQSAITLIEGLTAQIKAAGTDPAKLKALTDQLDASDAKLAAAITANTPATTQPATPTATVSSTPNP